MRNKQDSVNRNFAKDNNTPLTGYRLAVWKKRRGARGIIALFLFPAIFFVLTSTIVYVSFEPIVRPIAAVASLLVRDYEVYEPEAEISRNLLALVDERPEPVRMPVGSVSEVNESEYESESEEYVLMIPLSEIDMPLLGDQFARITISGTEVDAPVFWSDDYPVLNMGVGTHHRSVPGAWLPGFGRTVMLAGHRNTDFLDLFSAEIGEYITIETHYGTFVYEIVDIQVFDMRDTDSFDFTKEYENIIVYTCYPRDFVGRATYRLFVYGVLVSGTQVDITS